MACTNENGYNLGFFPYQAQSNQPDDVMTATRKPTALIILDGWGHRDPAEDNAISRARTPFWDQLWAQQPKTLINTSGMFVGLPQGQMGNSEVGHMNLGAGRVVYQSLTRIDKDIEDGNFQHNEVLCAAIDKAVGSGRAVHLMGLLSPGGVHSHEDHILAAAELAAARWVHRRRRRPQQQKPPVPRTRCGTSSPRRRSSASSRTRPGTRRPATRRRPSLLI